MCKPLSQAVLAAGPESGRAPDIFLTPHFDALSRGLLPETALQERGRVCADAFQLRLQVPGGMARLALSST